MNKSDQVCGSNNEELRQIVDEVPILKEKMVVDFINGLEVSNDHLQVRAKRGGLFSRFWDGITGVSFERQQRVDEQFQRSLETVNVWLQHLQENQIESFRAIMIVSDKLQETRNGIVKLVQAHLRLQSDLELLENQFNQFVSESSHKMAIFQEEISRLGLRQSAMIALDNVFFAWESGSRYSGFSPLIQLLLFLEELYWSPFGKYDRLNPEFRSQLRDRCVIQLKKMTGYNSQTIIPTKIWLEHISNAPRIQKDMIQYILEPVYQESSFSQEILAASQNNWVVELNKGTPIVLPTGRLSERLIREMGERLYA